MEKEQPLIKEITAIKNPRQAFFLTNNQAVINGESGCSIVDLSTHKEVKKISADTWQHLNVRPNKTTLALYNTNELKIFDTKTGNEAYDYDQLKNSQCPGILNLFKGGPSTLKSLTWGHNNTKDNNS